MNDFSFSNLFETLFCTSLKNSIVLSYDHVTTTCDKNNSFNLLVSSSEKMVESTKKKKINFHDTQKGAQHT